MACQSYSYFDLLSEIEEVSTVGHGKVTPLDCYECLGADEGVEGGLPSLCLSEHLLSEALLGDPLLPLLDEDALKPPPPAAHQPETLMQVSLPAGQPAAPGPAPAAPPPRPPSPAATSPQQERTPSPAPPSPQPLTGPSSEASYTSPASPVRVVVRTGRMVAPVALEKSSRYLVRIPGPSPLPATTPPHHHTLQEDEKPETTTATTTTTPAPEVTQTRAPSTRQSRGSTPNSISTTDTTTTPIRSIRSGSGGGARQGRCSKRKAYELEPQKDPDMERCRQNAINARRNRVLKKARLVDLEKRVEEGDRERDRLLGENRQLRESMARLERQVGHLTSVLRNDSRLSTILDKVSPARLSLGDPTPMLEEEEEQGEQLPGGVCLHLDGNEATLEFCSLCAKKASKRQR